MSYYCLISFLYIGRVREFGSKRKSLFKKALREFLLLSLFFFLLLFLLLFFFVSFFIFLNLSFSDNNFLLLTILSNQLTVNQLLEALFLIKQLSKEQKHQKKHLEESQNVHD